MKERISKVLYFLFIFLLFFHPINSGDFFHHLNSGRYVLNHFSLPYTDDLSFTAYGSPWTAYAWGSGVIYFILYSFSGTWGISVLFAVYGLTSALFLYRILSKLSISQKVKLATVFLVSALISLRWPTRPEVTAAALVTILLFLLLQFARLWFVLPVYFFVWSLLYGASAFWGIALFAMYLAVAYLAKRQTLLTILPLKKSIFIFILSVFASLLNGYGLKSFFYIFEILSIGPHTGEWLPLHMTQNIHFPELVLFYQYTVLFYILLVIMTLLVIVWMYIRKRHIVKTHLIFLGLALAMWVPFKSNKFINVAPILMAPIFAVGINAMVKSAKTMFLVVIVSIAVLASVIRFNNFGLGTGLEESIFPVSAVDFLKSRAITGNIFSSQEIGAYLSWQLPASKVFVDTRDDLYQPLGIFQALNDLYEGKRSIFDLFDKYPVDIVIGDTVDGHVYSPLMYDQNWSLVFLDEGVFIIVKGDLAQKHELRTYFSIDPLKSPAAKPGELAKAKLELEDLLGLDPHSVDNRVRLVEILLAGKEATSAQKVLKGTKLPAAYGHRRSIVSMEQALLAAKVYLANGDCTTAFTHLQKADKERRGKLIFFPTDRLPSAVERYQGEYYLQCTHDKDKARMHLREYMKEIYNPIEKREIEQMLY